MEVRFPRFPNEILALIAEELGDPGTHSWGDHLDGLRRCSLVSKLFAPRCQAHIFHTITLEPLHSSDQDTSPSTTFKFAKFISQNPRFAKYVKKLIYVMSDHDAESRIVVFALRQLRNVEDLNLQRAHGSSAKMLVPPYRFSPYGRFLWQSAVLVIASSHNLQSLSLCSLVFPGRVLETVIRLKNLQLSRTTFTWNEEMEWNDDGYGYGEERERPASPIAIKAATVQRGTFLNLQRFLGPSGSFTHPFLTFARLSEVDFHIHRPSHVQDASILLSQTKVLENLHIRILYFQRQPGIRLLTDSLNPSSFSTLQHLSLDIIHHLWKTQSTIVDPYGGFPTNDLLRFTALETLRLKVVLQGELKFRPSSFKVQRWARLDEGLTSGIRSGSLKNFREFDLQVMITVQAKENGNPNRDEHWKNGQDLANVLESLFNPSSESCTMNELANKGTMLLRRGVKVEEVHQLAY